MSSGALNIHSHAVSFGESQSNASVAESHSMDTGSGSDEQGGATAGHSSGSADPAHRHSDGMEFDGDGLS